VQCRSDVQTGLAKQEIEEIVRDEKKKNVGR
jgi:hypothetical protein